MIFIYQKKLKKDYIINPEVPTPNSKEEYIRLAGDTFHKLMQLNKSCEPEDGTQK
jgi:hypothetical protein